MLKKFRANNFKSLLNFEFNPTGLNLIVGHNNAGKTNLCSALRFVGLSSLASLDDAALNACGETWGLTNVYVSSSQMDFEVHCELEYEGQPLHFEYRIVIEAKDQSATVKAPLRVLEESLKVTGGPFNQTLLLGNQHGQTRLLHEEGFVRGYQNSPYYVETLVENNATMLSQLYDLKNNQRANLFKRYLHSWLYYNLSPDCLRSPDALRGYLFLRNDGANLSRAMYGLHNEKPRLERKIIELLKLLEPKLDLFSYSSPDPEHVYIFLEDDIGHRFSARSMSDGTLRFLAMAYLIITISNTSPSSNPPFVMIEEPENGLYVGFLKSLFERIDPSGKAGQFVFTSHNPYFIDLFDAHIEGIHVVKPGKPSSVLVRPDVSRISKLLSDMPLGEMHFRELLQ